MAQKKLKTYCLKAWNKLTIFKSFLDEIAQDGLTGSAWGDWANYTASPLR